MGEQPYYILGSLLWVKVGHHPYWPCMVSYDPRNGSFYKKVKGRKGEEEEEYHVQYFGKPPTHGWTTGTMFTFEGERKYLAKRDDAIKNAVTPSKKKKIKSKFHIPTSALNEWKFAVKEAERALRFRIEDRYELFVFKYDVNLNRKHKKVIKKRKRRSIVQKPKKKTIKPIVTEASNIDEPLCFFCERGNVDLSCKGICSRFYHKSCVGILEMPQNFLCVYCATDDGKQPCIVCKSIGAEATKCSMCNIYYHDYCLKRFKNADIGKNICSAHNCWSCYFRNHRSEASNGPFVTCFRCPTAFHDSLNCLPVGCIRLSPTQIVCPEHFLGRNRVSAKCVNSISFCASCFQGGKLVCCESCPSAFHEACINGEVPIGDFHCKDCIARKYLYVGEIVWAKCGDFRWWPAQLLDVNSLPLNVKKLLQFDGEFPLIFFGTDTYFWVHRAKVFPYNDFNKNLRIMCSRYNSNKDLYAKFVLSLEEAAEAYAAYCHHNNSSSDSKPSPFRHIRVNRAIPPAVIVNIPQSSCMCQPIDENPCGPESMCLNRSMLMECHAEICPAKDKCQNQRFQKRISPCVKVIKTENRGFGLQAQEFIRKETFIIEYVGEVISVKEYERRLEIMRISNRPNYYFLYLDNRRIIDAGPSGNFARFINHSCNPNCKMEKWSVNNDLKIGIFALKDIKCGEELTFNYQSEVDFGQKCYCGTTSCLGVIGGKNGKPKNKKKSGR